MINIETGEIHFDYPDIVLGPKIALEYIDSLEPKNIFKKTFWSDCNSSPGYTFRDFRSENKIFSGGLHFLYNEMYSIYLIMLTPENGSGEPKWKEKMDIDRKVLHDQFLSEQFRSLQPDQITQIYDFSWGKVHSLEASRWRPSSINILYKMKHPKTVKLH
jgi:hypothetical protein